MGAKKEQDSDVKCSDPVLMLAEESAGLRSGSVLIGRVVRRGASATMNTRPDSHTCI